MTEKQDKFAEALDQLISDGDMLHMALLHKSREGFIL
jgi:hypothetical protein